MSVSILSARHWQARVKRIAYQIYETNFLSESVALIGIYDRGYLLARQLESYLVQISPQTWFCMPVHRSGTQRITPSEGQECIQGRPVVLVDDVLFTGRTLLNTLTEVMPWQPESVQIAVLIDRGHRLVPLSPDFVGLDLATTIREFIEVEIDEQSQEIVARLV